MLAVTSNRSWLGINKMCFSSFHPNDGCETSVRTKATRRNIPEDGILHSRRRENLKSYIALTGWSL
jgi:hypothetical protein